MKMYSKKYDLQLEACRNRVSTISSAHLARYVREVQNVIERAVHYAGHQDRAVYLPLDNGSMTEGSAAVAWDVPPNMIWKTLKNGD